jgi:hypothetical protein
MKMTIGEALSVLHLNAPVTHDDVRKAFRMKAKEFHPDKHFNEQARELAAQQFLRIREASDLLMSLSEQQINHRGPERRTIRVVRRSHPRPAPVQPTIMEHPLIKELDNVVKLFHLAGKGSSMQLLRKYLGEGRFSPGNWMGKMYEKLFEKKFAGEDQMSGFMYGFILFIRLLWGSIFLIVAFFSMSILGLMVLVLVFPPVVVFTGVYWLYHRFMKPIAKKLNQSIQPGNTASWLKARSAYLRYRTLPLPIMAAIAWAFVLVCKTGSLYVITLSYLLCLLFSILGMSVFYEWLQYLKVKNRAV